MKLAPSVGLNVLAGQSLEIGCNVSWRDSKKSNFRETGRVVRNCNAWDVLMVL